MNKSFNICMAVCLLFGLVACFEKLNTPLVSANKDDSIIQEEDAIQSKGDTVWVESMDAYHPNVALLRQYFDQASEEFDVPVRLLMSIGIVESNLTQIGRPSIDMGWGIMHLADAGECKSFSMAANLLHVSPEKLKKSARMNIRGGAAVLDSYASESVINRHSIEEWRIPLARFSCLINENLRQAQAQEYMRIYHEGIQSSTIWGDTILLTSKTSKHE